jgi:excisionase family DNA binding protein
VTVALLRVSHLARFWEKTPRTVLAWIRLGRLAAIRSPGGHYRVRVADVRAFCEREGMPVPPAAARPTKHVVVVQGLGRPPRLAGVEVEVCDGPYAALLAAMVRRASLLVLPATAESFDAEPAVRALRRLVDAREMAIVVVGPSSRARAARLEHAGATRVVPRGRAVLAESMRDLAGEA